jgi:DNA-binding SARP family transcriptional activator
MRALAPTLQLFGPPAITWGAQRHDLPASAPVWLLACLGLAGEWQSREQLQLLFWPDASSADAQRQLRVTLHRSRQLLQAVGAEDALEAERTRLRLNLASDVARFRQAVAQGDWATALSLHRQPLLAGQGLRGFAELDEWLAAQREALQTEWRAAALREAAALEAQGQAAPAVALLLQQLQHDLLAEDVVQALLRLAAAAGERVAALAQFERFKLRAAEELGLAPLPATLALAEALRREEAPPPPAPAVAAPTRSTLPPVLQHLPLLGRSEELAWLRRPAGGLRVVAGEPGLGKTRLVSQAAPGALWVRAREGMRAAPLLALSQALAPHLATVRSLLSPHSTHRLELARLLPDLADGETLPPAAAGGHGLTQALSELLVRWPAPLVLDDLQWLDDTSLQVVAQALSGGAAGWLATLRSAEVSATTQRWLDDLEAEGRAERLDLPPWPAATVEALAAQVAGQPVPVFARWLVQRCSGNPFFALETLAALFDDGRLDARQPDWAQTLVAWPEEAAPLVPPRVAQVLKRRLGHLGEATQRVLGIAAVAGDAHALEALAELAGLSPWATAQALAEAQAAGLLNGRGFAHDLVRQMLLERLPEPLRAVLHAGVAKRLGPRLSHHVLADHWWHAGEVLQATEAELVAAARDGELGLGDAGIGRLQALLARLQALSSLPPGVELARVHLNMAKIERQREDMARTEEQALAALQALPMPATRQGALMELFEVAIFQGEVQRARGFLEEALAIDPNLPNLAMDQCKLAHAEGDGEGVVHHSGRFLAWLRTQAPCLDLAVALSSQACGYDLLGQPEKALALHQEALAVARRLKAHHTEEQVVNNLVCTLAELGRDAEAVELAAPLLAQHDASHTVWLRNSVAYSLMVLGRWDEAEAACRQVIALDNPNLTCSAMAKLLRIAALRGAAPSVLVHACEQMLAALASTEMLGAQMGGIIAVLEHGSEVQARQALTYLTQPPHLTEHVQRLEAALARRGWPHPCPTPAIAA